MTIEKKAAALAEVLFAQIQQLHTDKKSMKRFMRGELGIGAVCRNSTDLSMVFTQVESDPADKFISLQRPPGYAFCLMSGGPPESHGEMGKKQLEKLLNDDFSFEHLHTEAAEDLLRYAAIWKREIARRAAAWLEKRAQ